MKWQYKVEKFVIDDFGLVGNALNSLGNDGWELVTIIHNAKGTDSTSFAAILKRPNSN